MKKGKIISMPSSPEAQIRTRARNLPVGKCYVNENWEETQMASVIVSRNHVNGNVTYGFYLVDLYLLGVKDCFYAFNESPVEMEEHIHNQILEYIECDYELAHNIIYEGIAFAEDCGFEPVKEFAKTGVYILEEDSDDIPEMDIPLGKDGIPVVFATPDRNMQHEIAILKKTAGPGNFIVNYVDEEGYMLDDDDYDDDDYDDDDDDDDDFDDDFSYVDILNEISETGLENYLNEYRDTDLSPMQMLAMTDVSYSALFGLPDEDIMGGMLELILKDKRFDRELASPFGLEKYEDSLQSIVNKLVDDEDAALQEMEELVSKHFDDLDLGILQITLLRDLDMRSELDRLTLHWYDRASDHYAVRLLYAEWLTELERYDEVFELFGNRPGLDALTTDDVLFNDAMVSEFCACYLMAWLSKDKMELAEPYYSILLMLENWTPFVKNALLAMTAKKKDAVMKKLQDENKR